MPLCDISTRSPQLRTAKMDTSGTLSPVETTRKASSMFRKRPREWNATEDDEVVALLMMASAATAQQPPCEEIDVEVSMPLRRRQRRYESIESEWPLVQRPSEFTSQNDATIEVELSTIKDIQARVDNVGQQVAKALEQVTHLRCMMSLAIAQERATQQRVNPLAPLSHPPARLTVERMRISHLCPPQLPFGQV
ncbi:hypothetical protein Poli38472_004475 [Pythium oligandrum]|uniref:Uncharacterized protein n=1 Tax=Pythium oligandrum TaxID=41045 RepID=A0A8K1CA01_PYTOL|nr:hypothetical protein Poli38472_004475 [Pythium oligandrum]|eukprot:TMW59406.1 hypothetical protein Poli38472_004475 [Pythium oligandrum]